MPTHFSSAFKVAREAATWQAVGGEHVEQDFYYSWDFLAAWAREEGAEPLGLTYDNGTHLILYPVLRIPLDSLPGGEGLSDLRTPYDFGGPIAFGPDLHLALKTFELALCQFARDEGIVTEFARIQPFDVLIRPGLAEKHADNLIVDLRLSKSDLEAGQDGRHRSSVRAAQRFGLRFQLSSSPVSGEIDEWCRLYRATMSRLNASATYRSSDQLFHELLCLPTARLASVHLDDETLAMAIAVYSKLDVFYYLSASTERARKFKANNFLLQELAKMSQAEGRRFLHLGGGSPSLRHFKSQVATGTIPYFVVRRQFDTALYERLSQPFINSGEFPSYRTYLAARTR